MQSVKISFVIAVTLAGCLLFSNPVQAQQTQAEYDAFNRGIVDFNEGLRLKQAARYQEAISTLTRAIDSYSRLNFARSELSKAYSLRGLIFSQLDQFEQAIRDLTEAVRLDAGNMTAKDVLNVAYQRQSLRAKRDEAKKAVEATTKPSVVVTSPPPPRTSSGNVTPEYVDNEEIKQLREKARLNPNDGEVVHRLASVLYLNDRYEGAVAQFMRSIELDYKKRDSYDSLGGIFLGLGRYEEAVKVLRLAISLNAGVTSIDRSRLASNRFLLGQISLHLNKKAAAVEQYEVLKTLDPKMAEMLLNGIQNGVEREIKAYRFRAAREGQPVSAWSANPVHAAPTATSISSTQSATQSSTSRTDATPDQWKKFSSKKGRFTILMPGLPAVKNEGDGELVYVVTPEGPQYVVKYFSVNVGQRLNASQTERALDLMVQETMGKPQVKSLGSTNIRLRDYPGRHLKYRAPNGWLVLHRFYYVGQTLYQLILNNPPEQTASDKDIDRFFSSFDLQP